MTSVQEISPVEKSKASASASSSLKRAAPFSSSSSSSFSSSLYWRGAGEAGEAGEAVGGEEEGESKRMKEVEEEEKVNFEESRGVSLAVAELELGEEEKEKDKGLAFSSSSSSSSSSSLSVYEECFEDVKKKCSRAYKKDMANIYYQPTPHFLQPCRSSMLFSCKGSQKVTLHSISMDAVSLLFFKECMSRSGGVLKDVVMMFEYTYAGGSKYVQSVVDKALNEVCKSRGKEEEEERGATILYDLHLSMAAPTVSHVPLNLDFALVYGLYRYFSDPSGRASSLSKERLCTALTCIDVSYLFSTEMGEEEEGSGCFKLIAAMSRFLGDFMRPLFSSSSSSSFFEGGGVGYKKGVRSSFFLYVGTSQSLPPLMHHRLFEALKGVDGSTFYVMIDVATLEFAEYFISRLSSSSLGSKEEEEEEEARGRLDFYRDIKESNVVFSLAACIYSPLHPAILSLGGRKSMDDVFKLACLLNGRSGMEKSCCCCCVTASNVCAVMKAVVCGRGPKGPEIEEMAFRTLPALNLGSLKVEYTPEALAKLEKEAFTYNTEEEEVQGIAALLYAWQRIDMGSRDHDIPLVHTWVASE